MLTWTDGKVEVGEWKSAFYHGKQTMYLNERMWNIEYNKDNIVSKTEVKNKKDVWFAREMTIL